jgi:hypothetical protein
MEKIIWTDRVRNDKLLHGVKEDRNTLHTINIKKADWIGHILCFNFLLKHVIERKIERRIGLSAGLDGPPTDQLGKKQYHLPHIHLLPPDDGLQMGPKHVVA